MWQTETIWNLVWWVFRIGIVSVAGSTDNEKVEQVRACQLKVPAAGLDFPS